MKTPIAQLLGDLLLEKQWTISLAESCTGGGVAQAITAIAGSSQWFNYGLVTYSNDAKQQLLNVPSSVLTGHGAVSQPVASAMALGARDLSKSDIAIAITGIAGPGGGSPEKPVGTVWFAWLVQDQLVCESCQFMGDRCEIRRQAILHALQGSIDAIKNTV